MWTVEGAEESLLRKAVVESARSHLDLRPSETFVLISDQDCEHGDQLSVALGDLADEFVTQSGGTNCSFYAGY